ncbi:MAG: helix-turn-helix domain-containing protein [Clostridium sp.]|uniref:helix-turn-helix domain-containing protein n=1 Tax=Clostridium sp. TaxID=1506 RepID=UPI00290D51B5|nr:helix-turn-helix domain-containing protein [Clostridium sp.]MDU5109676.1 helix-turn-helix domain-containing protein [Clostridium sp.]
MEDKFYNIEQVAEILDVHHKTVRKFIKEGNLRANKLGKQWRISKSDLDLFTNNKDTAVDLESSNNDEEIEFENNYYKSEEDNVIKVSSVINIEHINEEEYIRTSNMLLSVMNCNDEKLIGNRINMKYSKNEKRLRIMLWGSIDVVKDLLDVISVFSKLK